MIFFIILILLAGALVLTGKPWIGIALSVMLFYLLFAVLVVVFEGRKLNLKVAAVGETEKGQEAEVWLAAENASRMPVARCDVRFRIKNRLTGSESEDQLRFGIFPKKKKAISLTAADGCCGMLQADLKEIRLTDPLGLFSKQIKTRPEPSETLVMPQLQTAEITAKALEQYDMESFRYADGRVGNDSSETVGIREYREGDSIRAIHWKLSAKQGEPVVKEYGYPVDTQLCVLADKGCLAQGTEREMDALSEYALGVSLALAEHDVSHTFGWFDRDEECFFCEEVSSREDVLRLLPAFLSAPFYEQADTVVRFLESEAEKRYASYLYVTNQKGKEDAGLDRLRDFGYVTVLTPEREKEENR